MLRLLRAGERTWLRLAGCRGLSSLAEEAARPAEEPRPTASAGPPEPTLRKCEFPVPAHRLPVQAWVESLRGFEQERVGLAELHPEVFATAPRLDILHQVAIWQKNFKRISYAKTKTRAEVRGGGRKPWRQKGSGRARHGSIRSPIWRGAPVPLASRLGLLSRLCPHRGRRTWSPGPHQLLLHAAHEGPRAGPQGGADHQARPGQPAHCGLPGAADRRPPVSDGPGPLPPLGGLRAPRGCGVRGDAAERGGGHLRAEDLHPHPGRRPKRTQYAQARDAGPDPACHHLPGGEAALAQLPLHTPLPLPPALQ
ncbi:large ribosomal subunit protein uL4m isoform X1 [Tamandua tetradactyla]|uniref:large ribosomal subunit protein uL4m isoform X1 n=1 Tax=Tamandua tetradactyla TaxID=48850 RepID=UPI004053AF18